MTLFTPHPPPSPLHPFTPPRLLILLLVPPPPTVSPSSRRRQSCRTVRKETGVLGGLPGSSPFRRVLQLELANARLDPSMRARKIAAMVRPRLSLLLLLFLAYLPHALVLGQYTTYNYGFDVSRRVKRQLERHPVVVVKAGDDREIHVRQEIRELEKDRDLWTLYILALSMMQYSDQSTPTSWYGITGLPLTPRLSSVPRPAFGSVALTSRRGLRDTRSAPPDLGRCRAGSRQRAQRVLHSLVGLVPDVASALSGSLRGTAHWALFFTTGFLGAGLSRVTLASPAQSGPDDCDLLVGQGETALRSRRS